YHNLSSLWHFNDRAQALIPFVGLEAPQPQGGIALILADRTGTRLLARRGLQTPFGTFFSAPFAALNNHGDVVFSADVLPENPGEDFVWRLYRVRSGSPTSGLEILAQPGDLGPDRSPIGGLFIDPLPAIANDGSVA